MDAPTWPATPPADHLGGAELCLRAWTPRDGPALLAAVLESLEELHPWFPWAHRGYGPDDAAGFIEQAIAAREDGTDFGYAIVEHDELAGAVGLHARHDPPRLEVGYWVHSAHTGRGLATRSVRLLARTALELPRVGCLEIRHDRANARSGRIPARLGFQLVGTRRKAPRAPGETDAECVWRLTDPGDLTGVDPGRARSTGPTPG